MSILNRLEIDAIQANELYEASRLAAKYKLPAIVVHPSISSDSFIARGKVGGRYKIITPIDWQKGDNFSMDKLRGLNTDSLEADGFEILLTPGKTVVETRNEANVLTDFIKRHLSPIAEIRFVIGSNNKNDEEIDAISTALTKIPTPSYIRNDIYPKTQTNKSNPKIHNALCERILNNIRAPLKVCGNINNIKTMNSCEYAKTFGVNLLQAKAIIKEVQQQPESIREMIDR